MDSATHLKVGWVYFGAAWLSLLLITGIIGVMLTPGSWAGFFNPSFLPSLVFRTCVAIMIAACYGYLSAAFAGDQNVRLPMTRFSDRLGPDCSRGPRCRRGYGIWPSCPEKRMRLLWAIADHRRRLASGRSWSGADVSHARLRHSSTLAQSETFGGAAMIGALLVMGGFE